MKFKILSKREESIAEKIFILTQIWHIKCVDLSSDQDQVFLTPCQSGDLHDVKYPQGSH